jgi:type II secretory pathway component PulC
MSDAPLDRHLLHALPWLAAIIAVSAAHVSVIEDLDGEPPSAAAAAAAPIVDVDVGVTISAPATSVDPLSLLPESNQVRLVPAIHDGRPVGAKLFGVRADSTLALLGLRNGDLIVRIDGQPVYAGSPTVAPYRSLHARRSVTVDIVRHDEPLSLTYAIE